ncbi:hypothetical protein D9M71_566090 [compost metagenome]
MAVRYFVNTDTRRARLGHGQDFARQALAEGFTEVTSDQFEDFRRENRARLRAMVAR